MARPLEQVNKAALTLFCDEAESFGMEAWCCNWHPRVQESNIGAKRIQQPATAPV